MVIFLQIEKNLAIYPCLTDRDRMSLYIDSTKNRRNCAPGLKFNGKNNNSEVIFEIYDERHPRN